MKLVFLADFAHFTQYGRPIVGGHYVAMEHGPVASEMLDDIKQGTVHIPFSSEPNYMVKAQGIPNEEYLSESDLEILREVNAKYGHMDKYALRDLTHQFNAWKKNYPGDNSSHPLPYEDFFLDVPEDRRYFLDIIRDRQEAWATLS